MASVPADVRRSIFFDWAWAVPTQGCTAVTHAKAMKNLIMVSYPWMQMLIGSGPGGPSYLSDQHRPRGPRGLFRGGRGGGECRGRRVGLVTPQGREVEGVVRL